MPTIKTGARDRTHITVAGEMYQRARELAEGTGFTAREIILSILRKGLAAAEATVVHPKRKAAAAEPVAPPPSAHESDGEPRF